MTLQRLVLAVCLVASIASPAAADSFSYVQGWVYSSFVRVFDPDGAQGIASIPACGSSVVWADVSLVETSYDLTPQSLRFGFALVQANGLVGNISHGFVFFRPTNDLFFALSGCYTMSAATGFGESRYGVSLYDGSSSTYMFANEQVGNLRAGERFELGSASGSTWNALTGTTTGKLLAGNAYQFGFDFRFSTSDCPGGRSASASGFAELKLSEQPIAVPAPEPWLGTVALMALVYMGRQRGHSG